VSAGEQFFFPQPTGRHPNSIREIRSHRPQGNISAGECNKRDIDTFPDRILPGLSVNTLFAAIQHAQSALG
jgi:hypothetical protein